MAELLAEPENFWPQSHQRCPRVALPARAFVQRFALALMGTRTFCRANPPAAAPKTVAHASVGLGWMGCRLQKYLAELWLRHSHLKAKRLHPGRLTNRISRDSWRPTTSIGQFRPSNPSWPRATFTYG